MIEAKYGDFIFVIEDDKTVNSVAKGKINVVENIIDDILLDYEEVTNKIPATYLANKLEDMGFEILKVVDYGIENISKNRIY